MPLTHWLKNAAAEITVPLRGTSSEHAAGEGQIAEIERQTMEYREADRVQLVCFGIAGCVNESEWDCSERKG